jgi:hypothetical protein
MAANLNVPRIDDWFWDVLESSRHSLRALCHQLEAMPREKFYALQYQYHEAMDYVAPDDEDVPVHVPADVDHEDFADWVVSQGRTCYYDLRRQAGRLEAYLDMYQASEEGRGYLELRCNEEVDRDEYRGWQSPFQVGFAIYRARFGKDIWPLITGYDWDPDLPAPA